MQVTPVHCISFLTNVHNVEQEGRTIIRLLIFYFKLGHILKKNSDSTIFISIIFVLLLFITACENNDNEITQNFVQDEYLPLKVGNKWGYEVQEIYFEEQSGSCSIQSFSFKLEVISGSNDYWVLEYDKGGVIKEITITKSNGQYLREGKILLPKSDSLLSLSEINTMFIDIPDFQANSNSQANSNAVYSFNDDTANLYLDYSGTSINSTIDSHDQKFVITNDYRNHIGLYGFSYNSKSKTCLKVSSSTPYCITSSVKSSGKLEYYIFNDKKYEISRVSLFDKYETAESAQVFIENVLTLLEYMLMLNHCESDILLKSDINAILHNDKLLDCFSKVDKERFSYLSTMFEAIDTNSDDKLSVFEIELSLFNQNEKVVVNAL